MSKAAEAWSSIPPDKRRYTRGPARAGLPNHAVRYVSCSHCKAKPGQLCRGRLGPTLGHHITRSTAFYAFKRAGKLPPSPPSPSTAELFERIEQRLARIDQLLAVLLTKL